jgi:hypothetical protein
VQAAEATARSSSPHPQAAPAAAFVPAGARPAVGQSLGTLTVDRSQAPAASAAATVLPAAAAAGEAARAEETMVLADAALPRWDSVAPGQGWSPTPVAGDRPRTEERPAAAERTPATTATEEEADEAVDEVPRHPYTWLHMIVLVVVAFVLGMLIFVVLLNDNDAGTQGLGAVGDVVAWASAAVGPGGAA